MVDACFILREERWLTDGLALELVDRPDSYITHDLDGEVKVKKNDLTEQYTRQATFSGKISGSSKNYVIVEMSVYA